MGQYDGEWKRVNGEKFFVVIGDGWLIRTVLLRDGPYSALDNTIKSSIVFKPFSSKSLEQQLTETIDSYVGEKNRKTEILDQVCSELDKMYNDIE